MERIAHKARSFEEAAEWDIRQHVEMSPQERQAAARALRERVYGPAAPDVREAERGR